MVDFPDVLLPEGQYLDMFDLSLFGDEWQGRIFDIFSSGPRGDIAETFTSDGPGSSISAHGA